MPASYRFVVTGRVQGVYFRESTRREAQRLGVSGWVANRPDGRVEGLACGGPAALAGLQAFLREGPPAAQVDALDWQSSAESASGPFEVRR